MIFYSPSTGGFYSLKIHNVIPADALEITEEAHRTLLDGLAAGQRIVVNGEFVELAALELDLAVLERAWRNGELAAVTWLRDRHRDELDMNVPLTLTVEQFAELLAYMHALRAWPQSEHFPTAEQRPQSPVWLVSQL